jgi:hypothetical protein
MKTLYILATFSMSILGTSAAQAQSARIDQTPDGMANITISEDILTSVDALLPESSAVNAEFLNSQYNPNLFIEEDSQLGVTFISEGAGYRNTLGYFTFGEDTFSGLTHGFIDTDGSGVISTSELSAIDGVTTGLVFPNGSGAGSGGYLQAGDTVVLGGGTTVLGDDPFQYTMEDGRIFEAGTNVGFFVAANAWNGTNVAGWDGQSGDPNTYYTLDFLNPENTASATIDNVDENARHTAMMFVDGGTSEILTGFEDLKRPYGDNDFNDLVFFVRSTPETAISQTDIYQAPDADVLAAPAPIVGAGPLGLIGFAGFMAWRRRQMAS